MSKWETVDPEQVEAQAMTTSKWDLLESSADNSQDSKNDTQESDPVDVRYAVYELHKWQSLFGLLFAET